jgi:hypothetical protein
MLSSDGIYCCEYETSSKKIKVVSPKEDTQCIIHDKKIWIKRI